MDAIYADYTISMSEFKRNPAQVLRTAGEKPVAVLNHNRLLHGHAQALRGIGGRSRRP